MPYWQVNTEEYATDAELAVLQAELEGVWERFRTSAPLSAQVHQLDRALPVPVSSPRRYLRRVLVAILVGAVALLLTLTQVRADEPEPTGAIQSVSISESLVVLPPGEVPD